MRVYFFNKKRASEITAGVIFKLKKYLSSWWVLWGKFSVLSISYIGLPLSKKIKVIYLYNFEIITAVVVYSSLLTVLIKKILIIPCSHISSNRLPTSNSLQKKIRNN